MRACGWWIGAVSVITACSGESAPAADDISSEMTIDDSLQVIDATAGIVTVRFVNLWTNAGVGTGIDIYADDDPEASARLFEDVAFGEATAPAQVPTGSPIGFFPAGTFEKPVAALWGSEFEAGVAHTVVLRPARALRDDALGGAIDVFTDSGESLGPGHGPVRPVDGVLLVANVSAAVAVLPQDARVLRFGTPGAGCLRAAGSAASTTMGGTATLSYDIPPGELRVAAYGNDDSGCAGPPRIAPLQISVPPHGRSYLFAYGTGPSDLRLLYVR